MNEIHQKHPLTRRQFLAAASAFGAMSAFGSNAKPFLRFGLITDIHYADAETRGTRHYRDSLRKTGECVSVMNQERVDFLAELGDFKDQTAPKEETTLQYLRTIEREFSRFDGPRYHALGNHDTDSISKKQFLANVENTGVSNERSFYSFECKGVRFIVLDANFRKDGVEYERGNFEWTDANVPPHELDWLRGELKASSKPVIVFIHQLLDGKGNVYVKNAEEVRGVLEESGKVLAVFQGHHHDGQYNQIGGIHYYTLKGAIEGEGRYNNSYAIVEVRPGGAIDVIGFRTAVSLKLS